MRMAGCPPVRHDAGCLHMGRSCIVVQIESNQTGFAGTLVEYGLS
jgi:hypothetical protein